MALVVETPELLRRLAPSFQSSTAIKFAVLLWGKEGPGVKDLGLPFPVYTYEAVLGSGRTSRAALAAADHPGEAGQTDFF